MGACRGIIVIDALFPSSAALPRLSPVSSCFGVALRLPDRLARLSWLPVRVFDSGLIGLGGNLPSKRCTADFMGSSVLVQSSPLRNGGKVPCRCLPGRRSAYLPVGRFVSLLLGILFIKTVTRVLRDVSTAFTLSLPDIG